MHKKEISPFSVESFLYRTPKQIGRGALLSQKNFWVGKKYGQVGGYHDFPSNDFSLRVPTNVVDNPSVYPKVWGFEKLYAY